MESLTELKRRVDKRVGEIIIERLLEAGYKQHLKHGHKRLCDCSFCKSKRHNYFSNNYIHLKDLNERSNQTFGL